MKHLYTITGMTCSTCKSAVEQALLSLPEVTELSINLEEKTAAISMKNHIATKKLQAVLPDKYNLSEQAVFGSDFENATEKPLIKQLFPLFLIFAYIITTAIALNVRSWNLESFMLDFMGLFYIIFSLFKFLDVKGFAMSFQMYDPLAKKMNFYGFIYPFIELLLGILFLSRVQIDIVLVATLLILGITTFGVIKALLDKKTIQCACLGSVLKLPMTKATFIENSMMMLMAIWMLI